MGLLFTTSTLFSQSYYAHDFRDYNTTYKFNTILDIKSDNLPIDFFDTNWKDYDKRKKDNSAFGVASTSLSMKLDYFTLGLFGQKNLRYLYE